MDVQMDPPPPLLDVITDVHFGLPPLQIIVHKSLVLADPSPKSGRHLWTAPKMILTLFELGGGVKIDPPYVFLNIFRSFFRRI